jgi:hypothetical protein
MFKYETHLHTYPVSRCAQVGVKATLDFYKVLGYQGVFITNHFLDGNINIDSEVPYEEKIEFYFSDFEEGKTYGKEIGLDVFCGVEMSYKGTDFLVFGLDKKWWLAHPEIMLMKKSDQLPVIAENGALVIQAHPFRNGMFVKQPGIVDGIEVYNGHGNHDSRNDIANMWAEKFGFRKLSGSDFHGVLTMEPGGVYFEDEINDSKDVAKALLANRYTLK